MVDGESLRVFEFGYSDFIFDIDNLFLFSRDLHFSFHLLDFLHLDGKFFLDFIQKIFVIRILNAAHIVQNIKNSQRLSWVVHGFEYILVVFKVDGNKFFVDLLQFFFLKDFTFRLKNVVEVDLV